MLGRMIRGKRDAPTLMDVFLDHATYNKFRAFLAENSLDESNGLVRVLERGMANYWLQEFKQLKQDYQPMEKLFNEYKNDNELLNALEQENEHLKSILEEVSTKKASIRPQKPRG